MLTTRGYRFLLAVLLGAAIGAFLIPYFSVLPALAALALLGWFGWEWMLFAARAHGAVARLRVGREVRQAGRDGPTIWAGVSCQVRVWIENPSPFAVPFAIWEDRPAVGAERPAGSTRRAGPIPARGRIELAYTIRVPAPGVLRFEGVEVLLADAQGFFHLRRFLRDPCERAVLPPLTDDEGRQRATKRFNGLPPPGIHRLRRPGSGSELLDLRDYRPGDPPKMIAWKPSARRDALITKEYENDVPVRCVLFVDASEGVRLGPPGNTVLTRLVGVAATVAQAALANRDLVGLCVFDERRADTVPPARTSSHLVGLLRRLSEVAALQPEPVGVPLAVLTERATALAHELYPDLMDRWVNSLPLRRAWLPLLDRRFGWLVVLAIVASPLVLAIPGWGNAVADFAAGTIPRTWPFLPKLAWFLIAFLLCLLPPATLGLLFWFAHGVRGWFGERRQSLTHRKQLCALMARLDGSGPGAVERYLHDDEAFAARLGQFLRQHLSRYPVPLYDARGEYRFRCADKAGVLAGALLRAVGRARDNELYVILADLTELGADLAPVVRAVRVARARHHQVLVVIPWPDDVPDPEATTRPGLQTGPDGPRQPPAAADARLRAKNPARLVHDLLACQYHEAFRQLRWELGRVGASVIRIDDGDATRAVLERLDRLRGMRTRR